MNNPLHKCSVCGDHDILDSRNGEIICSECLFKQRDALKIQLERYREKIISLGDRNVLLYQKIQKLKKKNKKLKKELQESPIARPRSVDC
jgi:uncharacterized coiled-coil DUF342 family protein